jgi:hypothetical protein
MQGKKNLMRCSMIGNRFLVNILLASSLLTGMSSAIARDAEQPTTPQVGVGAQYDTTQAKAPNKWSPP